MGIRGGQLSKLQHLRNKVLHTPTRDLHMAFEIAYLHDFVTKLRREQATVILNYENVKYSQQWSRGSSTKKVQNAQVW
jgi:hypothetical protein